MDDCTNIKPTLKQRMFSVTVSDGVYLSNIPAKRNIDPVVFQWWANVADGGPAFKQCWGESLHMLV